MKAGFFKLDDWVKEIIVDPLSKEPLTNNGNNLTSPYGRKYPIINDIYDLRLLSNGITADQKIWIAGQREYERWSAELAEKDHKQNYFQEIEAVQEIYDDIPIEGRCLDVGGHQGRLRHFLSSGQEYVTCDPYLNVFDDLDKQPNLIKVFPFLLDPVNFICCHAELLPFQSSSFQTVHMRSVIDHLLSPELALNESYRVLRDNGALIVGLLVKGGKRGRPDMKYIAKEFIRAMLVTAGIKRFKDYHVWHPTYNELTNLISDCGFSIDKIHWVKGFNDTVCYIRARKRKA